MKKNIVKISKLEKIFNEKFEKYCSSLEDSRIGFMRKADKSDSGYFNIILNQEVINHIDRRVTGICSEDFIIFEIINPHCLKDASFDALYPNLCELVYNEILEKNKQDLILIKNISFCGMTQNKLRHKIIIQQKKYDQNDLHR